MSSKCDTTSDFAEIVFAILGVAAKLERRHILERTARGRADAKAKGVKFGRKPILTPHQQQEARKRLGRRRDAAQRRTQLQCQPEHDFEANGMSEDSTADVGGADVGSRGRNYLNRAIATLREGVEEIPDHLLAHQSPLGWEHVNLTGDYIWAPADQTAENTDGLRPLRPAPHPALLVA